MLSPGPLPLARYALFHTDDVDQARESVARVFCPHALATCHRGERLDARHHSAPLARDISLNYVQYGAAVRIDPGQLGDFYLLQLPLRGGASVWCGGREVRADPAIASLPSPTEPLYMHWEADSPHLIVRVARGALTDALEQLAQAPPGRPLVFAPDVSLAAPQVAPLIGFVHYLRSMLDGDPDFSRSALARQAERYLLAALVLQLPHSHRALLEAGERRALLPRAVRRAQDYMHAHATESLTLTDLCRVLGVSARTLQQAFLSATGETPMAYWRDLRLDAVRNALRQAGPDSGLSVASVAARYGFIHLGHFAARYRRRFGQRPQDTLRVVQASGRLQ